MKRLLMMFAVAATASGTVYGAASTLGGLQAQNIAADSTTIAACDSDGVRLQEWVFASDRRYVQGVWIDHVHEDCVGLDMVLQLYDADGNLVEEVFDWTGTVLPNPPDDMALLKSFESLVRVEDVASVHIQFNEPPLAQP
jgi:hypothetical protein